MKRKVCSQCKKYFPEDYKGHEHSWFQAFEKMVADKDLDFQGEVIVNSFTGEYHSRERWGYPGRYVGPKDCGPIELIDVDDYWEQVETLVGHEI